MKRRSIAALLLVTVVAAAVAATTSGATKKANASSITVWLQTDAQSGWADLVASVNQKFQSDHPGTTVNVQYQNWGDHLQKFDATLAGGGGPDVIEMGNTEMTKYMAAGAFADLSSAKSGFDNSGSWLKGLAASGVYHGKTYGVPYYAGSRVVTYRSDLFKKAGISKLPNSTAAYSADAQKLMAKNAQEGLLADLHRGHRLVLRDGLRVRLRRRHRDTGERQVEGRARLAEVDRRPDRVQELLRGHLARVEDDRRDAPEPVRRLRTGTGRLDDRAELVQLLCRRQVQGLDRAVRDAGPRCRHVACRASSAAPISPCRSRASQKALATDWIKDFTSTSSEKTLQAKGNIPNATNLLGATVNERAASRSWFVPTAKHWVDVENGNILRNMLAQILTGKLSVKQAAQSASDNIASVLNQP